MSTISRRRNLVVLSVIACFALGSVLRATALDDYVRAPDSTYSYKLVKTIPGDGLTGYVLDMYSQTWRSKKDVDRPHWQHWVSVIVPEKVKYNRAMLMISGGSNGKAPPSKIDKRLAQIALATHSVVAIVSMIPNEPLKFTDASGMKSEDAIIAYTWDKYLKTGDTTWILQLPMVKSVVRAMDAVQTFCVDVPRPAVVIRDFVVTGASKRGWTTWLTTAVDSRVVACMPIVIDMLNLEKSFRHHFAAYGFWAPAVHDYEENKIFSWFGTEPMNKLISIVDPFVYRDRLTMPKYLINSAGDQFFVSDSSQFYFDELKGPKYLRYVPNTDHSLSGSDAVYSLTSFYQAIVDGVDLPRFSWRFEANRAITVTPVDKPARVLLWQASNPRSRDFRKMTIGTAWTSSPLQADGRGVYRAKLVKPAQGWRAYFIELDYEKGLAAPLKFTTGVKVVPDVLPFAGDKNFDGVIDDKDKE